MDIKTPEERSRNMAAIHSRDTKPEVYFRKLLFARGYRYSIAPDGIPGHPDIYLRKYNTAVFINGCFWHRHQGCRFAYIPKSNVDYWARKFDNNVKRDMVVRTELEARKIKCLTVWECTVKRMMKEETFEEKVLDETEEFFQNDCFSKEI